MSRGSKGQAELSVLVTCHSFLVAIPARTVVRLFLPEEVQAASIREGGPLLGTIRAGERLCAAWDLGRVLEQESLASSWVVVDVPHRGSALPIALRAGVCALVAEVRPEASLPGRIFRARSAAFPAAFAATADGDALPTLFGLWLDPARLFASSELDDSRAAIAEARARDVAT